VLATKTPKFHFCGGLYSQSTFHLVIIPAKAREYVFTALVCVGVCVCLSVTTITKQLVDGFAPNLCEGSLGETEDQVRVSLRSVEGCGCNGQKKPVNRRLFTE